LIVVPFFYIAGERDVFRAQGGDFVMIVAVMD
jgi:hypothetical protein